MKIADHIGNVTIVIDRSTDHNDPLVLLGLKRPKDKMDLKRKRKRIGVGHWVPPGGATEKTDKSQKHAAQRELSQEAHLFFPLHSFKKVAILRGYLNKTNLPTWLVHIYLVDASKSDRKFSPNEEYVKMNWFRLSKLPFKQMLQGDRDWLPRVVSGQKLSIRIVASQNATETSSVEIRNID